MRCARTFYFYGFRFYITQIFLKGVLEEMTVWVCLSDRPSLKVQPKPIDRSRSKSISRSNSKISRAVFYFSPNPKIRGNLHKKKFKISIFSKMAPTILIKFCGLMVHSKPNNMILSDFPGKILEIGKILYLGCGIDVQSKFVKKWKSNFLTIAILPSFLMSLVSKN